MGPVVDSLVHSGLGHSTDVFIAVASQDAANITDAHFEAGSTHLQARAVRGVVSLERGKADGKPHCQGGMVFGLMPTYSDRNKFSPAMRKPLRDKCGFTAADRFRIEIKPLVGNQTFA